MKAVITGRRASQGADRANLQPLEVDSTGLVKLNPLFAWTFPFVEWYVDTNNVPRNKLLSQGYRSIGDWHSTVKSGEGDTGERAGRWAGKKEKTECGLHVDYFQLKAEAEKKVRSLDGVCAVHWLNVSLCHPQLKAKAASEQPPSASSTAASVGVEAST